MTGCLLGVYQGDRHLSIDNYLRYCQRDLPGYLPRWTLTSLCPGGFENDYFASDVNTRPQAWRDQFLSWPLQLHRLRADLFHIVDQGLGWYRLFLRKGKVVVTVHDLINLLVMRGRLALDPIPSRRQLIVKLAAEQIKRSDAVICVSHNTADCVLRELAIPAKRLHVIYNTVPAVFKPPTEKERCEARKQLFRNTEHVVLHVGKPSSYKNRLGVLKIFELVHQRLPSSCLVLTSDTATLKEQSLLKELKCAPAVQVLTPENQENLRLLYNSADVLLFPSLYEGFGWPPLEAMACGCPVVSSTAGSLLEVVGQAGITIPNPLAYNSFADTIVRVLTDRHLADDLRSAGRRHIRKFSSEILTPQLADVYQTVAAS